MGNNAGRYVQMHEINFLSHCFLGVLLVAIISNKDTLCNKMLEKWNWFMIGYEQYFGIATNCKHVLEQIRQHPSSCLQRLHFGISFWILGLVPRATSHNLMFFRNGQDFGYYEQYGHCRSILILQESSKASNV